MTGFYIGKFLFTFRFAVCSCAQNFAM